MHPVTNASPLRQPSAWLPLLMSGAGIFLVALHLARYGFTHDTDEGTSAHLFQILMVLQVPVIGYFAVKWLPTAPRAALAVLLLQGLGIMAALASVYFLEHAG
jgi:hypothetical protein